jgi:hypothetical protein
VNVHLLLFAGHRQNIHHAPRCFILRSHINGHRNIISWKFRFGTRSVTYSTRWFDRVQQWHTRLNTLSALQFQLRSLSGHIHMKIWLITYVVMRLW